MIEYMLSKTIEQDYVRIGEVVHIARLVRFLSFLGIAILATTFMLATFIEK